MATSGAGAAWPAVACVEVGGGGIETVVLGGRAPVIHPGAVPPAGLPLLLAVPGMIERGRVVAASNLGWYDVDPAKKLGLTGTAALVRNDAEAAALGEAVLRGPDGLAGLSYVGLGTGVGGAVVRDGRVVRANLFGHQLGFGEATCRCHRHGCLETVAAGWALPDPIPRDVLATVATSVARAVEHESLAPADVVLVVGGGMTRRYPQLVELVAAALPARTVEASVAPRAAKSAAAWGLAHAFAPSLAVG